MRGRRCYRLLMLVRILLQCLGYLSGRATSMARITTPLHRVTDGYSVRHLKHTQLPMGYVLSVERISLSLPAIPSHLHAGSTILTYLLPWSAGHWLNEDSAGHSTTLKPGDVLWQETGMGLMHEDAPSRPGVPCEALQITIKSPDEGEDAVPRSLSLNHSSLKRFHAGDKSQATVLVGYMGGQSSQCPSIAGLTLTHLQVDGAIPVRVPEDHEGFFQVLRGSATIDHRLAREHTAGRLLPGKTVIQGSADVLVGWGRPMPVRPLTRGAFCMFGRIQLERAMQRYRETQTALC
ncbi:MAG: pirin family protein [Saccharospirillum sp.]